MEKSVKFAYDCETAATDFFCQLVSNARKTDIYSVCYILKIKTHYTEQLASCTDWLVFFMLQICHRHVTSDKIS